MLRPYNNVPILTKSSSQANKFLENKQKKALVASNQINITLYPDINDPINTEDLIIRKTITQNFTQSENETKRMNTGNNRGNNLGKGCQMIQNTDNNENVRSKTEFKITEKENVSKNTNTYMNLSEIKDNRNFLNDSVRSIPNEVQKHNFSITNEIGKNISLFVNYNYLEHKFQKESSLTVCMI